VAADHGLRGDGGDTHLGRGGEDGRVPLQKRQPAPWLSEAGEEVGKI
jgi:hypothetical protein